MPPSAFAFFPSLLHGLAIHQKYPAADNGRQSISEARSTYHDITLPTPTLYSSDSPSYRRRLHRQRRTRSSKHLALRGFVFSIRIIFRGCVEVCLLFSSIVTVPYTHHPTTRPSSSSSHHICCLIHCCCPSLCIALRLCSCIPMRRQSFCKSSLGDTTSDGTSSVCALKCAVTSRRPVHFMHL